MAADAPPTLGLILAGGRGRRMGGLDKALLPLAGRPLIAHVIDRLHPQCDQVIVNANGDPERLAAFGLPVVADAFSGFQGPLAGVLTGLVWLETHRPDLDWLVTAPVDTPFLPNDLVVRLHRARIREATTLASAVSAGRTHPTAGLWSKAVLPDLRRALIDERVRKVEAFTERMGVAKAAFRHTPFDPFHNVNRPQDLDEAERLHGLLQP